MSTPVKTGRARSNWFVGLGNPNRQTIAGYGPGGGNTAISFGRAVISTSTGPEDIFISNNLDYIAALNRGSSLQAPAGFVERAVQIGAGVARVQRLMD